MGISKTYTLDGEFPQFVGFNGTAGFMAEFSKTEVRYADLHKPDCNFVKVRDMQIYEKPATSNLSGNTPGEGSQPAFRSVKVPWRKAFSLFDEVY
ncbi:MAG: hypothetical protein Q4G66_12395 [bacterium]|nr:hypothetical protein [bacterium]